jgi:hypothetical protein
MYISCVYTGKRCIDKIYKASFSPSSVQQIMPYYLLVAHVTMVTDIDLWEGLMKYAHEMGSVAVKAIPSFTNTDYGI